MIEIISATRQTGEAFSKDSALGVSLRRLAFDKDIVARVAFENRTGLPAVYNAGIAAARPGSILVFMHDDVWIEDIFFSRRVVEALESFDVVGVAGNRRRVAGQPAWAFVDAKFTWDDRANLSDAIGHGKTPFGRVSRFGPAPAECELLDGVFLAARAATLAKTGVGFDPRFDFHLYDMDFCRAARARGLRLGTAALSLTHQSGGAFGTPGWARNHAEYSRKWGD